MMITAQRRSDLTAGVQALGERMSAVARNGGCLPVAALMGILGAGRLDAASRQALEARGAVSFRRSGDRVQFENVGQPVALRFPRFKLVLPKRLAGYAEALGPERVRLCFHERFAPEASRWFYSVQVDTVELAARCIVVRLRGQPREIRIEIGDA